MFRSIEFVKIILSCSTDSTTNSESINPNFYKSHVKMFCYVKMFCFFVKKIVNSFLLLILQAGRGVANWLVLFRNIFSVVFRLLYSSLYPPVTLIYRFSAKKIWKLYWGPLMYIFKGRITFLKFQNLENKRYPKLHAAVLIQSILEYFELLGFNS